MLFALLCACALSRRSHRSHRRRSASAADYEALARACRNYLEMDDEDSNVAGQVAMMMAPAILESAPTIIESVTKAIGTLTGKQQPQQEQEPAEPEPTPVPVITYAPAPPDDAQEAKQNRHRARRWW